MILNRKVTVEKFEHCESCPSKGMGIFCELERSALDDVSDHKVTNVFKKGQTLFVEGSPPFGLYCISKGNIKITKSSESGKDAIVRVVSEGDVLGHRSIFTSQNYGATATAIEDTSVCFIDKKYIMKLVQDEPSVACNLIAKLGEDLGASETKVASFSQKSVLERTCELLLLLNESHGQDLENGDSILGIILTREEIASMVGTATETIIRVLSDLKKENIIAQEGKKIIIRDEDKLIDFANLGY